MPPRNEYVVKQVITYVNEETGSEITLIPADEYQVTTMVDFGTKILGTQNAYLNKLSDFKNEIADARTFSFCIVVSDISLSTYTIALFRSPPFMSPWSISVSSFVQEN